ncbi:hypothetical protein AB1Y20_003975 [Prymnesium parvum]|uniref:Uncharacterized protein n=1 Tax=Prymnesium parvum TaxID=97485 RepID=A0AB34J8F4_PRYPA
MLRLSPTPTPSEADALATRLHELQADERAFVREAASAVQAQRMQLRLLQREASQLEHQAASEERLAASAAEGGTRARLARAREQQLGLIAAFERESARGAALSRRAEEAAAAAVALRAEAARPRRAGVSRFEDGAPAQSQLARARAARGGAARRGAALRREVDELRGEKMVFAAKLQAVERERAALAGEAEALRAALRAADEAREHAEQKAAALGVSCGAHARHCTARRQQVEEKVRVVERQAKLARHREREAFSSSSIVRASSDAAAAIGGGAKEAEPRSLKEVVAALAELTGTEDDIDVIAESLARVEEENRRRLLELHSLQAQLKEEEAACDKLRKSAKQLQTTSASVDTSAHAKERQRLDSLRKQAQSILSSEDSDSAALEALLAAGRTLLDRLPSCDAKPRGRVAKGDFVSADDLKVGKEVVAVLRQLEEPLRQWAQEHSVRAAAREAAEREAAAARAAAEREAAEARAAAREAEEARAAAARAAAREAAAREAAEREEREAMEREEREAMEREERKAMEREAMEREAMEREEREAMEREEREAMEREEREAMEREEREAMEREEREAAAREAAARRVAPAAAGGGGGHEEAAAVEARAHRAFERRARADGAIAAGDFEAVVREADAGIAAAQLEQYGAMLRHKRREGEVGWEAFLSFFRKCRASEAAKRRLAARVLQRAGSADGEARVQQLLATHGKPAGGIDRRELKAMLKELLPEVFDRMSAAELDALVAQREGEHKRRWSQSEFSSFYRGCLSSEELISSYAGNVLLRFDESTGRLVQLDA